MATSFQAFPPPITGEMNPATSSYHSTGSYGTVFVVLAVIVVVSAAACVIGRFCGKRSSGKMKVKKSKNQSHGRSYNNAPDVELGFGPKGTQIELGFDKKIPKVKVAPNGYGHGKQAQNGPPRTAQFAGNPMCHTQLPMMECPTNFLS